MDGNVGNLMQNKKKNLIGAVQFPWSLRKNNAIALILMKSLFEYKDKEIRVLKIRLK